MATISMPTHLSYKWWDTNKPSDLPKTGVGQLLKEIEKIDVPSRVKLYRSLNGKDPATIQAKTGWKPGMEFEELFALETRAYVKLFKTLKDLRDGIRGVPKHKDFLKGVEKLIEIAQEDNLQLKKAIDHMLRGGDETTALGDTIGADRAKTSAKRMGGADLKAFEEERDLQTKVVRRHTDALLLLEKKVEKAAGEEFTRCIAGFKKLRDDIDATRVKHQTWNKHVEQSSRELQGKDGFDPSLFNAGRAEVNRAWEVADKALHRVSELLVTRGKQLQSGKETAKQFINTPAGRG